MDKVFGLMIDDYLENQIGISDSLLSSNLLTSLTSNLENLFAEDKLINAKIGNTQNANINAQVRKDKIFWLDRLHENQGENDFFDIMDKLVIYLNQTCYTGITSYEFHYALYEPGSFYKKHLDQFNNNSSRQYTLIFYLNADWQKTDGGELCVYVNNKSLLISPNNGKSVFFKSNQLEHEVLTCNAKRMSITGWFKTD
jgi:SM-20-related protein